ncbi:MAG: hypothetical protein FVQ77_08845 [Cytophagales bacterium]|nr:hypothetical protein [Cytophagales bacterium]
MKTIQIPLSEYQDLKKRVELLKDTKLLDKFNRLIDLLYEDRYGLFMKEYTEDLTEYSINDNWKNEKSAWDKL